MFSYYVDKFSCRQFLSIDLLHVMVDSMTLYLRACLATMAVLYYRIAQRGFGEELPVEEQP